MKYDRNKISIWYMYIGRGRGYHCAIGFHIQTHCLLQDMINNLNSNVELISIVKK